MKPYLTVLLLLATTPVVAFASPTAAPHPSCTPSPSQTKAQLLKCVPAHSDEYRIAVKYGVPSKITFSNGMMTMGAGAPLNHWLYVQNGKRVWFAFDGNGNMPRPVPFPTKSH